MSAKKKPKKRLDLERPHCNGEWTTARFRSFVMSALRGARWAPKYDVIDRAFSHKGLNPKTGRMCHLHRCESCQDLFAKGDMKADHHEPIIPLSHDWAADPRNFLGYDWNEVMRRLWIEKGVAWNVLCEACHHTKTQSERAERAALSKQSSGTEELF